MDSNSFTIYNASAGSGKTFTLVKEYLKLVLTSKNEDYYKCLLAITFTNKAVAEMKQRIINGLIQFSSEKSSDQASEMLRQIADETGRNPEDLKQRSKKTLKHLLHHYSSFKVETIDGFNHKLIRTFARDLKLPQNFEVSLDVTQLLSESVDRLINKAGSDKEITQVLIDFALEKTDDDKSWDITRDIAQVAQILLNENDSPHLAHLKNKSLEDFLEFKRQIISERRELVSNVKNGALEALQLMDESGLEHSDFSGAYLPKHFQNLADENFGINFAAKWQENMHTGSLYPKRVKSDIAAIVDELTPVFLAAFENGKKEVFRILLLDAVLKNITPLSVINLVNREFNLIKEERSLLPITEFNALINTEIKNQPIPFIYERLGEKYYHFFIDEFQDTSLMQWQNLMPLIDNTLSQQRANGSFGSLLIVGDAKQSIYRWRGGLPEQFISLYEAQNPFAIEGKKVINLETNFRSCAEIVQFNNAFFSFIASHFGNITHNNLYQIGNKQHGNEKKGGYVKFDFIETENAEEANELYCEKVGETIDSILQKGFTLSDICILTRTRRQGISVGSHLLERGISIISSETLLLQHSSKVQCIIDTLILLLFPENEEVKMRLLTFLFEHFTIEEEEHTFLSEFKNTDAETFEKKLSMYNIEFKYAALHSISLFDSCEYIMRQFNLNKNADAYLFSFMDFVFEFQQQPRADKLAFLDYWDTKKDSASVPASENTNAVQLMTIHKSKGLEFPVVIFPFADVEIYKERNAKTWYPWNGPGDFKEVFINYKNEVEQYGEVGELIYKKRRETLELDNINLLYVTLTRAIEQLYIFSTKPGETTSTDLKNFNQFFGEFLKSAGKWNDDLGISEFGSPVKAYKTQTEEKIFQLSPSYLISNPQDLRLKINSKDALLWESASENAIKVGNLLHQTMAQITTLNDVDFALDEARRQAVTDANDFKLLSETVRAIVATPELKHLFEASVHVKNERDIISSSKEILRPDRINFHSDNSVTIIDYKTGKEQRHHKDQVSIYAKAIEEMGYSIKEKLVVYSNEGEIKINKV